MNNVTLIGRLTRDPELRYLQDSSNAYCRFTLAVDRRYSKDRRQEAEGKGQPTADFIGIVAWGKTAELCANYLAKGRLVAVNGRIQTGNYTNTQGQKVYTTDVVAENVEFIDWGNSQAGGGAGGYNQAAQQNRQGFNQGGYGQPNYSNSGEQNYKSQDQGQSFGGFDDSGDDFIPFDDDSKIPF